MSIFILTHYKSWGCNSPKSNSGKTFVYGGWVEMRYLFDLGEYLSNIARWVCSKEITFVLRPEWQDETLLEIWKNIQIGKQVQKSSDWKVFASLREKKASELCGQGLEGDDVGQVGRGQALQSFKVHGKIIQPRSDIIIYDFRSIILATAWKADYGGKSLDRKNMMIVGIRCSAVEMMKNILN